MQYFQPNGNVLAGAVAQRCNKPGSQVYDEMRADAIHYIDAESTKIWFILI